jgi:hypothetical protein
MQLWRAKLLAESKVLMKLWKKKLNSRGNRLPYMIRD